MRRVGVHGHRALKFRKICRGEREGEGREPNIGPGTRGEMERGEAGDKTVYPNPNRGRRSSSLPARKKNNEKWGGETRRLFRRRKKPENEPPTWVLVKSGTGRLPDSALSRCPQRGPGGARPRLPPCGGEQSGWDKGERQRKPAIPVKGTKNAASKRDQAGGGKKNRKKPEGKRRTPVRSFLSGVGGRKQTILLQKRGENHDRKIVQATERRGLTKQRGKRQKTGLLAKRGDRANPFMIKKAGR